MNALLTTLLLQQVFVTESPRVAWTPYDEARQLAAETGKLTVVHVTKPQGCRPCDLMKKQVFTERQVVEASRNVIMVKVNGESPFDGDRTFAEALNVRNYPADVFIASTWTVIGRSPSAVDAEFYAACLTYWRAYHEYLERKANK
ncbi:MAG: thioredoxin fold domain-containing protein [Planctomycetota bacterium]